MVWVIGDSLLFLCEVVIKSHLIWHGPTRHKTPRPGGKRRHANSSEATQVWIRSWPTLLQRFRAVTFLNFYTSEV